MTPAAVVTAQPSSGAILRSKSAGITRHAVLGNDGVFVERRHPAGIELLAAPSVGRRLALDALARAASAARRCRPACTLRDARADLEHGRRGLVAEQVRQELVRALGGLDLVDLRAADRRVVHLDQHLADVERFGQLDLVDDQRLARLARESPPWLS